MAPGKYQSAVTLVVPMNKRLTVMQIYAQNYRLTTDVPTFKIVVSQVFVGKHRLNLSDDQILYSFIGGVTLFCCFSIVCFLVFRRKRQLNEHVELAEYEENYMAIRSLRILIKKKH